MEMEFADWYFRSSLGSSGGSLEAGFLPLRLVPALLVMSRLAHFEGKDAAVIRQRPSGLSQLVSYRLLRRFQSGYVTLADAS